MSYQTDEKHLSYLLEYFVGAVKLACYSLNTRLLLRVFTNNLLKLGCAFRRIPAEVGQKSPSQNNVKVLSTRMRYNTIIVFPVHSGWYSFSMRSYSNTNQLMQYYYACLTQINSCNIITGA